MTIQRIRQEVVRRPCGADISVRPAPRCFALGGNPTSGGALIHWRPVIAAAAFSALFIVVILVAVSMHKPSRSAGKQPPTEVATRAANHEPLLVQLPVAVPPPLIPKENPPAQLPAKPASAPEVVAQPVVSAPPPPEPMIAPPAPAVAANKARDTETFGTCVEFASTPVVAARKARAADKLLFVLHVSGDFEDSRFT